MPGYKLISVIGSGAQGTVHKATQLSTGRLVALKLLRYSRNPAYQAGRFEYEISLLASLDHPNIVTVYDGSAEEGRCFLAMKYIHGHPLNDYLATHQPPVNDILRLMVLICRATDYAHHRGVVHRDLKPANILVDHDGQPHILDFGIAKSVGLDAGRKLDPTSTGQFMGTLAYAAPEQLRAEPSLIDDRTDVYTLGVILYESLTGRQPYELKRTLEDFLDSIANQTPPLPSSLRPELSLELDLIVMQAMAKEKERRYQTAGALADDIERHLRGDPISAKRDSLGYILQKRARRQVRKHPFPILAAMAVLAVLLAVLIVDPLENRWTSLHSVFSRAMTNWFSPTFASGSFDHVRVVGMQDDTDFEGLAAMEGLEGVSGTQKPSLRRLHGKLMQKLAQARPRVVVWDIAFVTESAFDPDFVAGVQALAAEGIDVVVASPNWWLGESEVPGVSTSIAPHARIGCITGSLDKNDPWRIDFTVRRGTQRTLPSLALQALASFRRPGSDVDFLLVPKERTVELHYWKRNPGTGTSVVQGDPDRVLLSYTADQPGDNKRFGLLRGDLIGAYEISVPADAVLNASTIDYRRVFSADSADLRAWFEGRAVIVADIRSGVDRYPHPDGRLLLACFGHAIGIEDMINALEANRRLAVTSSKIADPALAALAGILLAWVWRDSLRRRMIGSAVLAIVCIAGSVALAATWRILWSPLVPLAALVLAAEMCAPVWRSYFSQRTG